MNASIPFPIVYQTRHTICKSNIFLSQHQRNSSTLTQLGHYTAKESYKHYKGKLDFSMFHIYQNSKKRIKLIKKQFLLFSNSNSLTIFADWILKQLTITFKIEKNHIHIIYRNCCHNMWMQYDKFHRWQRLPSWRSRDKSWYQRVWCSTVRAVYQAKS